MTTVAGKLNSIASVVAVGAAVIAVARRHAIAGGVCALFLVSHFRKSFRICDAVGVHSVSRLPRLWVKLEIALGVELHGQFAINSVHRNSLNARLRSHVCEDAAFEPKSDCLFYG